MSKTISTTDNTPAAAAPSAPRLVGRLGSLGIAITVFGYLAPLAAGAGYVPLVIGYGNGIGAPSAFIAVGLLLLVFAAGYTALVRAVPRPGGFYTYISAGLGKQVGVAAGFLATTLYLLAGVGFSIFAGLSAQALVAMLTGAQTPWWLYVIGYVAVSGYCSYRGADFNARFLGVVVAVEVAILVLFNVVSLLGHSASGLTLQPFTFGAFTSGSLGIGLLFASNLYAGFESTSLYREEARDPQRSIPRATYAVIIFATILYGTTAWSMIVAIGPSRIVALAAADPASLFTTILTQEVSPAAGLTVAVLLLLSALASQLATVNATARYLYSLSSDALLPRTLAVPHPKLHSPSRAALVTSGAFVLVLLLVVLTGTDPTTAYTVFGGVGIFAFQTLLLLVSISCVVFFARNGRQGYSLWRVVIAPAFSAIAIIVLLIFSAQQFSLLLGAPTVLIPIGFAFVISAFIGGFIYAIWLRKHRPSIYKGIGREAS